MEQHPAIFGEKDFGVYHGVTRRLPGHQSEGPTIPAHVLRARAQAPPHPAAVVGAGLVSSSTPTGKLDPGKQLRGGYHFPNLNVHIYISVIISGRETVVHAAVEVHISNLTEV